MADADAVREPGLPAMIPGRDPPAPIDTGPGPSTSPSLTAGGEAMSLADHLGELRSRLVKIIAAIVAFAVVGYWRSGAIIDLLRSPIGGRQLVSLSAGGPFFLYVKVALVSGIILAMPVILYQVWAFI